MTVTEVRTEDAPSFAKATSHLLAGSVAAQVLVALTFAAAAQGLGKPVFGLVVALLGVGAVGQDLLDFGTSQWLGRELAAGRISAASARGWLRQRAAIVIAVAIIGVAVAAFFFPLVVAIAAGSYVVCAVVNAGTHARLRAAGRFGRAARHLVAERLGWLILVLLVLLWRPGRETAAAALVGAMALVYVVSSLCGPRERSVGDGPRLSLLGVYRKSLSFGLLGLSSDLQQLDASAAAAFGGVAVAAEVGIASKLTGPVGLVAGTVSQVAFRGVSRGGHEADRTARSALRVSGGLGLAIAAFSPILPIVAVAVLGDAYDGARTAIIFYALGTALAVLNQPLAGILTAGGSDRHVSRVVGPAVLIGLVVGSLQVRSLGATGMALGFCLTQALIFGACAWLYLRRRR